MSKSRIAVAGAGYIGLAHIDAIRQSPTCALSAIVDPSPAAQARAEASGVPRYKSLDELLATDTPDGVVLATPNQLHVAHALTCIAAHLPILLEKPIAPTVASVTAPKVTPSPTPGLCMTLRIHRRLKRGVAYFSGGAA